MRLLLTFTMLIGALPVGAQTLDKADLEPFFDGMMPLQLQREDIAGAVISVVKDGQIVFAKGYGYSDVEKKLPMKPDATLVRPGSISKLFTWTSVMQLVEQKKIDLDRDVNDYLDFKVPAAYGKPITMRNIMTHTAGFEEVIKNLFVANEKDLKPLGEYLKASMPKRVFAPGTIPAYSNYATGLAGYIVQRVSGEQFDDYVEHHILQPLGMTRTTFRQPLPGSLKPMMSNGYQLASQPAKSFEFVQAWPAGSASTTATDMARFMIAHLQDGRYNDVKILEPQTAQLMHSAQFTAVPPLNHMALGFYEETRNGQRIIGHGGDTAYFHSDLHLILAANVGFFISYNSAGRGQISPRTATFEQLLDRYFPYHPAPVTPLSTAAQDAREVSGSYLVSRRAQSTLFSFISAIQVPSVSINKDGTISMGARDLNGQPKHFREIAPMVFRDVNGQDLIAFKKNGSDPMLMGVDYPFMVFQKAPWYESGTFNYILIFGTLGVFLLTVLLWPVAALVRWHYSRPLELTPAERRRRLFVRIVCLIEVIFALVWLILLTSALGNVTKLNESLDPMLRMVEVIGWLGVIGGLFAIYDAWFTLRAPNRWWFSRVHAVAVAIACVAFSWFIYNWHLLPFSLKF